jgi:hypothetical protein
MTVLDNAPQKDEAVNFMVFHFKCRRYGDLQKNGQEPLIPFSTEQPDNLPLN